ncbi:hypothetical protein [Runella limosa]|uniref:hypothetical protein n=1 Tax=Runella limosa TaxID=370978 RepID=UPI00048BD026|nr:hypothetical protein [Runella limosa]
MYRIANQIYNTSDFSVFGEYLSYSNKDNNLYLNLEKVNTNSSSCGHFFSNDYFYFSDSFEDYTNSVFVYKQYIMELNTGEIIDLKNINPQFLTKKEGEFIGFEKKYNKSSLVIYNVNTSEKTIVSEDFEFGIKLFNNNNLVINDGWILVKSLSLLTGEYEWEVDLSEYGQIRSVLTAVEDNLWVLANDYKNNRHSLLRLDANSGRLMQVLGEDLKLSDAHVKYIEEKQTLLSFKSSISSVPSPSTLIEIDAKTGKILRNVTVESMLEPNLKVGLWQYQDNQLFFTANTTMMTTTHIGVLDYNTLALLWYIEVPGRKGLLKDIQVSTGKIYVLDQVGTLHIFEKEND